MVNMIQICQVFNKLLPLYLEESFYMRTLIISAALTIVISFNG